MPDSLFRPAYDGTPALRQLLGRAMVLSHESPVDRQDGMDLSFTTLLLALFAGNDAVSSWFRRLETGIVLERALKNKGLSHETFERVRSLDAPEKELEARAPVATTSVNHIFDVAFGYVRQISVSPASETIEPSDAPPDMRIDVRHVFFALLLEPGASHVDQMRDWGLDPEAVSNAFLTSFVELYPSVKSELKGWCERHSQVFRRAAAACLGDQQQDAFPPPVADRLPGYSADMASGEKDMLKIDTDVNALAALIAAHTTSAPLAVGVFGDWGSGKTFFMRRLMRRIDSLARAARCEADRKHEQAQREIAFYKHIVQIEFNAWHYVEGNLWASLVEHIFANLRLSQDRDWDPDGTRLQAIQDRLLEQLQVQEVAVAQATAEVDVASQELEEARENLTRIKRERESRLQELADVRVQDVLLTNDNLAPIMDVVNGALVAAGFEGVSQSIEDVNQALTEARATLQAGGGVVAPFLRSPQRGRYVLLLLAALAAAPLAGLLASWLAQALTGSPLIEQMARISATIVAVAGFVAETLRRGSKWTGERLARIEEANRQLRDLQQQKMAAYNVQIAHGQEQLARLNADFIAAQQRQEAAQRRMDEIRRELEEAAPVRRLVRYIEDRTNSDDYRKHLGILALIRRDFETISAYINAENGRILEMTSLEEEQIDYDLRINRIVLYIDDLDRCPADKVVQVLQAIHLLSVFPMFVIVVGVDARWVSHSLKEHYRYLLTAERSARADEAALTFGRDATPHDYLEKIFQIPIWLRPVDADGSKRMLAGMLAGMVMDDPVIAADAGSGEMPSPRTAADAFSPDRYGVEAQGSGGEDNATPATSLESGADTGQEVFSLGLAPESLTVCRSEMHFMEDLAPILGRSPRAIKRFVNVYRLVKVALDQSDTPIDIDPNQSFGDFRVVMFLLGVVTGLPTLSREFFRLIRQNGHISDPGDAGVDDIREDGQPRDVRWAVAKLEADHLSAEGLDLHRLKLWLDSYEDGAWWKVSLASLAARAPQVARYSFRVEEFQVN